MIVEKAIARSARRILRARFGQERAGEILRATLSRAEESNLDSDEESRGGRLMVRLAAFTACLYRELLDQGLAEADARRETAAVTAHVYRKMARIPWAIARLSTRSPLVRLRRATEVFRHFPFGPPSYVMKDIDGADAVVAFDVTRCPVANYFRAEGLGELCIESFCNLDFELAHDWGAQLERTTTLAGGDARCDFRWRLASNDKDTPGDP